MARIALGAIWLAAAAAKLHDRSASSRAVAAFDLLPDGLARVLGTMLPYLEAALGTLLVLGYRIGIAALISAGLLAVFSVAMVASLLQGKRVECHCFGSAGRNSVSWWTVGRNGALLVLAVLVAQTTQPFLALDALNSAPSNGELLQSPSGVEGIPAILLVVVVFVVILQAQSIGSLLLAIAKAEGGPALASPQQTLIRKWFPSEANPS